MNLLGLDIDSISALLWFLALLIGFVIGGGLKHSFKVALILLGLGVGAVVVGGIFVAENMSGISSLLSFVDPATWLTKLFNWVGSSVIAAFFCMGLALGCWKG